jgi:AraC-like DNA-binding protein
MSRSAPPPLVVGQVQTHVRSLEEARELYGRSHTPVHLQKMERGKAFEWRAKQLRLGPILIAANWYGHALRAWTESSGDAFSLTLPLGASRGEATHDRKTVPLIGDRSAWLASPNHGADVRLSAGYQSIQIVIPGATVQHALGALTGAEGCAPPRFEPRVSIDKGCGASLLGLARYFIDEMDRQGAVVRSPVLAARLADALLFNLLLGHPYDQPTASAAAQPASEPQAVRQAAAYLDAHASEPIRLTELSGLAGVSLRSIQAGFRRHRGCSPMEFLRERRLDLVRARLLQTPDSTVTRIAHECGFAHLGRFSAYYRSRFGENPIDTLRGGKGRRRRRKSG